MYRAQFYIQELKKYATWPEYLAYYKEQDDKIMMFSSYCMQMWSSYMNEKIKQKEEPLSYKEYPNKYKQLSYKEYLNKYEPLSYKEFLNKYKELLEEGYNARPQD